MKKALLLLFLAISVSGCGIYTFSGASISPDVKTVSIAYFNNQALLVNPQLSQVLTDKLKQRFGSQSNLTIVKTDGDLQFEGYVADYKTQPISIQTGDVASQNRLSIRLSLKYVNLKDEKQNFETTFERYADYDAGRELSSIENDLVQQITDQLIDDIFNKSVANW